MCGRPGNFSHDKKRACGRVFFCFPGTIERPQSCCLQKGGGQHGGYFAAHRRIFCCGRWSCAGMRYTAWHCAAWVPGPTPRMCIRMSFLRLLCDTTAFADDEHLKAWLLRVTASRCNDLRRAAWFKRTAPLEALRMRRRRKTRTIPRCGRRWRACLHGCVRRSICIMWKGYGTEEIAHITGCRPATVRTRLHRARKQLKEILEGDDDETNQTTERFTEDAGARIAADAHPLGSASGAAKTRRLMQQKHRGFVG